MAKPKATTQKEKVTKPINLQGTRTQRTSSTKPNVSAKPKTEKEAKAKAEVVVVRSPQEAHKLLLAEAKKNTRSKSKRRAYPRMNGKVVELAPAPRFPAKAPSRAKRMRPHTPIEAPKISAKEKRALDKAIEKQKAELIAKHKEAQAFQEEVAKKNKRRLAREANPRPPKQLKLKVRVQPEPIKVIVLKGNSYRRPCGVVPPQFAGAHIVRSDSPMFSRKGSWPPAHYNDAVPLPSLSMGLWLSERATNDLDRMLKEMRGLGQRCMTEINEIAKSGKYKTAPFPEIRRRLVMSLCQELKETL